MRQIVLDTETTGLDPAHGHRVIEIGCVELMKRRPTRNTFHEYINPEREIDEGALEVHGITREFLSNKARFADLAEQFLNYLKGAELVIHNAAFDIGFLDHEFKLYDESFTSLRDHCQVLDTLTLAREMHPGQRNSLDALCKRYQIDNAHRTLHGALLDAQILSDVYLSMTGGQKNLLMDISDQNTNSNRLGSGEGVPMRNASTLVVRADEKELSAHQEWLTRLEEDAESGCLWS
ncbi:MAG: DNA polymerase III subunit epsilon [Arenicellales bacterium WSBS_2016_MAG_OTU3]